MQTEGKMKGKKNSHSHQQKHSPEGQSLAAGYDFKGDVKFLKIYLINCFSTIIMFNDICINILIKRTVFGRYCAFLTLQNLITTKFLLKFLS
jgi:hypothetical protein